MPGLRSIDYYDRPDLWSATGNYGSEAEAERAQLVADLVVNTGARRVLDVGAGSGLVTNRMLERGLDVVAYDLSGTALEGVSGPSVIGDMAEMPFRDGSFEAILVSEVLEHLGPGQWSRGLSEVARVASETVVLTVPNDENLRATAVVCPECYCQSSPFRHVRSFRDGSFAGLVPGFRPASVFAFGPYDARASRLEAVLRRELLGRHDWVNTSVCPQCGFTSMTRGDRQHAGRPRHPAWVLGLLRRKKRRWLAAVLRRHKA